MASFQRKLSLLVTVLSGLVIVRSEPVRGGYDSPLQNLGGGYGAPFGGNRGDEYGHEPANYDFHYEVFGGGNEFGHQESRRDQVAEGKYHVLLPDGRRQIVNYIADESGYHPVITYEQVTSPFDASGGYGGSKGPSGGYGGNKGPSGGYGAPGGSKPPTTGYGAPGGSKGPSAGYGAPNSGPSGGYDEPKPSNGYGAPIPNNHLGGYGSPEPDTQYGVRSKRQFLILTPPQPEEDQSEDLVKVYKNQRSPAQRFRNRRRRYSPRKAYLVVYPDTKPVSIIDKPETLGRKSSI